MRSVTGKINGDNISLLIFIHIITANRVTLNYKQLVKSSAKILKAKNFGENSNCLIMQIVMCFLASAPTHMVTAACVVVWCITVSLIVCFYKLKVFYCLFDSFYLKV